MNLKQTMKFPLETPGQKNEGKSAPGRAHLGIFFFLNPKHTGKNKPTRLHWMPEAGWRALTRCWAGSEPGTLVRPGHMHVSRGKMQEQSRKSWAHTCRAWGAGSRPGMEQSPACWWRMRAFEGGAWTEARWEGRGPLWQRAEPRVPQGGSGQDSPSECFWPGRGPPDCQAGAPPARSHSPDLLQIIVGVFYFFPCEPHRGTKAGSESPGTGPHFHPRWSLVLAPTLLEDLRDPVAVGAWPRVTAGSPRPPLALLGALPRPPTPGAHDLPGGPNGEASSPWRICNSWLQPRLH